MAWQDCAATGGHERESRLAYPQGDFRKTQTLAGTREFDLNDPDALKKDRPAREGDDDPRLGPASLQKFDGEDLQRQAREETLRQELLDTWHAQRADLEARARAARETGASRASTGTQGRRVPT